MLQKMKNRLKDQRGLTLIELLAVIVILGIIAAIAIPSIMGIINNSKADAHIANAQQIVNSTKLYLADAKISVTTTPKSYALNTLTEEGYLETIDDPSGNGYDATGTKVYVSKVEATESTPEIYYYKVLLKSDTAYYIGSADSDTGAVDVTTLERDDVNLH